MTIEAAQTINELNTSYPRATDLLREGDDHIRMVKATLQRTFPRISGTVNISSTTLNSLNTILNVSPTNFTVKVPVRADNIYAGTGVSGSSGTLRIVANTDREFNFSILQSNLDAVTVNYSSNVSNFNWNNMSLLNARYLSVNGQIDTVNDQVARLSQAAEPANPAIGAYLNTPAHQSGFHTRGSGPLNGDPNNTTPYGYFAMYAQEHVGSMFSGILQLRGFSADRAWHFNQDGTFDTPHLYVQGNTNLAGNMRIVWGGRGHTYQENGDIVENTGTSSIFRNVGNSTTLSGSLNWCRDNSNGAYARANDAWNKANDAQVNRVTDVRTGAVGNSDYLGNQFRNITVPAGHVVVGLFANGTSVDALAMHYGRIQVYTPAGGWHDSNY